MAIGSSFLLSFATISIIIGISLVGIAGYTENWYEYSVPRKDVIQSVKKDVNTNDLIYFTRNYGLYHVCFPGEVPNNIGSFPKMGQNCIANPDFKPTDEEFARFNDTQKQHWFMVRVIPFAYASGFILAIIGVLVGCLSCAKKSSYIMFATSTIISVAGFVLIASMIVFHLQQFFERHLLTMHPYYKSWDGPLKGKVIFSYGWSFVLAWVGILVVFISAISFCFASKTLRQSKKMMYRKSEPFYGQHYDKNSMVMPYGGYNTYDVYSNYYQGYPTMQAPNYYGPNPYAIYGTQPNIN